jgi:mRNA interferase RelE/StbE
MNDMITIPKEEFDRLVEAAEDLADMRAIDKHRQNPGEGVDADFVRRMLDGESLLRLWRDHRGLTQQALAAPANVNRVLIAQIEKGRKTGSVDTLKALADTLEITVDDLIA